MKIVVLTRKFLLELWREPLNLGLIFGFPIVLLGFYYLAFGGNQSLASFLNLLVINEDQGAWGELLVGEIETAVYENEPLFTITHISDRQAAETRLRERKAALLLEIPSDFSEKVEFNSTNNSAISHATDVQPVTLHLVGDTNSDSFIFAQSLLEGQLRQFVNGGAGQETAVPITYTFLPGTGTMSDFDFGVSGIIVFGLSLLVVTTAQPLVREYVNGTLHRLQLSTVKTHHLLLGVGATQLVVAVFQIPVTFAAALLMGFQSNGSIWLGIGVGLLFSVSMIGLGLITTAFSRSDGEAANLGASLGVLLVLISGAMFPLPEATLFVVNGRSFAFTDLIPAAHAAEALRRVLVFGDGVQAIAYELMMLTLLSILLLLIGMGLYQKRRMVKVI